MFLLCLSHFIPNKPPFASAPFILQAGIFNPFLCTVEFLEKSLTQVCNLFLSFSSIKNLQGNGAFYCLCSYFQFHKAQQCSWLSCCRNREMGKKKKLEKWSFLAFVRMPRFVSAKDATPAAPPPWWPPHCPHTSVRMFQLPICKACCCGSCMPQMRWGCCEAGALDGAVVMSIHERLAAWIAGPSCEAEDLKRRLRLSSHKSHCSRINRFWASFVSGMDTQQNHY